jgi:hypothetical protein
VQDAGAGAIVNNGENWMKKSKKNLLRALVWNRCCRDKPPQLVIVVSIVAGQVCSLLRVPLWDLCCCEVVAVDPEVVLVVFFPS